ncbi:MAG: glycosyltransferase family 2 protein, partial [Cyanobacteriota bacterium]|nr:glycosyltransferase family 2 protein [Cyanobacteriota bacterium]
LEEIGGFVTESISEDYFTGIRLSAQGYQLIYLKEKLSAGLAAENVANYFVQRQRWGRGTLQAFFIKSNPLTIPNLKLSQRLAHLEGLINWLTVWAYPYFLLMPLGYAFFGILPIQATVEEWLYFFLPHFCVQIMVFRWLNEKSRSAIISEIYQATICFPLSLSVFLAMMNPFKQRFKVTEKGISNQSFVFNWALGWPLIIFFVATFIGFFRVAGVLGKITISSEILEINPNLNIGLPWMIYNLFAIGVAIFALVDAPQLELYEKFDLQRIVRFKLKNQVFWGMTTKISEVGAEIQLTHELEHQNKLEQLLIANQPLPIQLDIVDEGLKLTGNIIETAIVDSRPTLQVQFKQVTLSQHRELIKILFCRPGQWKDRQTPGEIRSLFLILKTFFNPPFLRNRNLRRKVSR